MASEVFQPYHNISKTPPNIAAGRNKSGTAALAEDTLDHLLRFLKESDGSPGRTDAAIASERDDGTLNLFAIQMRDGPTLPSTPLHWSAGRNRSTQLLSQKNERAANWGCIRCSFARQSYLAKLRSFDFDAYPAALVPITWAKSSSSW